MISIKRRPKTPDTRPRGIIKIKATYNSFLYDDKKQEGIAEVREVEKVKDLSHIEITKVTGMSLACKPEELLPEWVPTKRIIWVDGGAR